MPDECNNPKSSRLNYYGCIARRIFLAAGVFISLAISFFSHLIPVPPLMALGVVVALVFVSGWLPDKIIK